EVRCSGNRWNYRRGVGRSVGGVGRDSRSGDNFILRRRLGRMKPDYLRGFTAGGVDMNAAVLFAGVVLGWLRIRCIDFIPEIVVPVACRHRVMAARPLLRHKLGPACRKPSLSRTEKTEQKQAKS